MRFIRIHQPLSAAAIVVTLALGIGATTATHAAFGRLFAPGAPGVSEPEQVISVRFALRQGRASGFGSREAVPVLRDALPDLDALAYWRKAELAIQAPSRSLPAAETVEFVSAEYFAALGVRALAGRLFADGEADSSASQIAVISEAFWRSRFGADPSAIGQTLRVGDHPLTIVGVTDAFRGQQRGAAVDVWVPIGVERLLTNVTGGMSHLVGRVRPGTPLSRVQSGIEQAYERAIAGLPIRYATFVPIVEPGYSLSRLTPATMRLRDFHRLLLGGAFGLLLLACANAGGMLVTRANARARETAVRLAMGAGPLRIARGALADAVLLGLVAGVAGIGIAVLVTEVLSAASPVGHPAIDSRIVVTCVVLTLATSLVSAMLPTFVAARQDIRALLGRGGPAATPPHRRLRSGLAVAGLVFSMVLVSGAGLLNASFRNLAGLDTGLKLENALALTLDPDLLGRDDARAERVRQEVVDSLRAAGFPAVARAAPGALAAANTAVEVRLSPDALPMRAVVALRSVSADYFRIVGLAPLEGRVLLREEFPFRNVGAMPVVLSESFAAALFGAAPAVGRRFELQWPTPWPATATVEVVGVVRDTRSTGSDREFGPALYHPGRSFDRRWSILVESFGPAALALDRAREAVRRVDARLPVSRLEPLEHEIASALVEDRTLAQVGALFGTLASTLAISGLVALMWQLARQRRREIAIRLAVGASSRHIVGDVLKRALLLSGLGLGAGLGVYWWCSSWLAARLYGVSVMDAGVLGRGLLMLFAVTCLASLLPAVRATQVDPMAILRDE